MSRIRRHGGGGAQGRVRLLHSARWRKKAGAGFETRSPSFLWVHLYDPHLPYAPPEPYASVYAHNPYVGEIAYADSQIGRLLRTLEDGHLLERTIVIVAGDHGESLGDPELTSGPSLVSQQLAEQLAALGYVGRRGKKPG